MTKSLELVHYPDLQSQVEAIERDGFAYFPDYLNSDEVAELRACMDRTEINEASFDRQRSPEKGGFYEKVVNNATDARGLSTLINSSRTIIYASSERDFAEVARERTRHLRDQINMLISVHKNLGFLGHN